MTAIKERAALVSANGLRYMWTEVGFASSTSSVSIYVPVLATAMQRLAASGYSPLVLVLTHNGQALPSKSDLLVANGLAGVGLAFLVVSADCAPGAVAFRRSIEIHSDSVQRMFATGHECSVEDLLST